MAVRAALVTWHGRAALLPGSADPGQAALMAALDERGAVVHTIDLTVLDAATGRSAGHDGGSGTAALAVDLVAVLRPGPPGSDLSVRVLAAPEVAYELIAHTEGVDDRVKPTRDVAHAVARSATGIGVRWGEADEAAAAVLAALEERPGR